MHTFDIFALCVAGVFIVAMASVLARQRYMLRSGGAVPMALRQSSGRWGYGIARYAGGELRWYRAMGIGTRPSKVLRRGELIILARRSPDASEASALPARAVVVECRQRDKTCVLALSDSALPGFVSWLEASAPRT